jgi:hypothetical protein
LRNLIADRTRLKGFFLFMDVKLAFIGGLLDLERRVCRIYERWADNKYFSEELRSFWKEMVCEEKQHLAILERSAGLLNFAAAPRASAEHMERVAKEVSAVERASQDPEPAIDAVLGHALALESCELNELDDAWLRGFQPDPGNLTETWGPAQERHIRRLVDAVRRFATDDDLRKEAAALLARKYNPA